MTNTQNQRIRAPYPSPASSDRRCGWCSPVSFKVRNMQDAEWNASSTVAGVPAVFEYITGGALVFNY